MYMIAGLGNPEPKYDGTRHNVGFETIDHMADRLGIRMTDHKFRALMGSGRVGEEKVLLVKPLTYMNLSGESLQEIVNFYKLEDLSHVIVISDDVDLEVGKMRIRRSGSAGGHNGLKNIILHLGSMDFPRIRIGVGHKPEGGDLVNWVLGHFDAEGQVIMDKMKDLATEAALCIMEEGTEAAMNRYNGIRQGSDADNDKSV